MKIKEYKRCAGNVSDVFASFNLPDFQVLYRFFPEKHVWGAGSEAQFGI